jgi:hypothetical protein
MAKLSPKVQARIDGLKKSTAATRAKLSALTASKPARIGIAAAGGAIGGALHAISSIELAGREIPWSLPAGLVIGAVSKDARVESAALGMVGHGAGVMVTAEWDRMGYRR